MSNGRSVNPTTPDPLPGARQAERIARGLAPVLRQFGGVATITRTTGGTFNPATGMVDGATSESYRVAAVVGGPREHRRPGEDEVRVWAASATIGAGTVEPRTGDRIAIGGRTYTVGEVTAIRPDGLTPILYCVELIS